MNTKFKGEYSGTKSVSERHEINQEDLEKYLKSEVKNFEDIISLEEFIGGQSDCVVSGISPLVYRISSTDSGIFDSYSGRNMSSWEYFTDYSSTNVIFGSYVYSAFEEFAVYFNLHEVVVYDLEE